MKQGAKAPKAPSPSPQPNLEPLGDSDDEPPEPAPQPFGCLRHAVNRAQRPLVVIQAGRRNARSNPQTLAFRRKFFAGIPDKNWNDWQWQIQNRIRSMAQLSSMLRLAPEEQAALVQPGAKLPVGITPYFMSLVSPDDARQALRRTVIPTTHELVKGPGEADDPLGEEHQSPVSGLVHRYPDRALLLMHDFCSTYCRYCTRSRMVGHSGLFPSRKRLESALAYIQANPAIRDVLLSGGDPLTLSDERLDWILMRLRQIPHVEIIRIGTKVPAVLPQRITTQLTRMLRRHHPLWMSLHFAHPDECTPEASRACGLLADAGIPLGSQTVLLRGINDTVNTMRELVHHLMRMRVKPYYLYQCDPISGSAHFRTTVAKGLEIIEGLRGHTTGYAVPTYVVDAPGGGGKIPLMPDYLKGRNADSLVLRNYQGKLYSYPDPPAA